MGTHPTRALVGEGTQMCPPSDILCSHRRSRHRATAPPAHALTPSASCPKRPFAPRKRKIAHTKEKETVGVAFERRVTHEAVTGTRRSHSKG
eukprot:5441751-Prymnesium_polylepis.1